MTALKSLIAFVLLTTVALWSSAFSLDRPAVMSATGSIEVAFSPNEGAEALIIKVIDSAKTDIRVLAYSFTSAPITSALLSAAKRGVSIVVVADEKNNVGEDRSGKAKAALSALTTAKVNVRTISAFAIHHDKVLIVDGVTVQTGSYNYSAAAASRNSENVIVNWNNRALAKVYIDHFDRNFRLSKPYQLTY